MSDGRQAQTPAPSDLPSFTILVDEQGIPTQIHVASVKVSLAVNRIPSATITVLDGSVSDADFAVSNSETFVPGKSVTVRLGYHSTESVVFKGVIISHQLKVKTGRPSALIIECRHRVAALAQARKSRYFEDMTDSDIMENLFGAADLTTDIDPVTVTHSKMVQYNSTDWDFIVTRAEANGKLVLVEPDTVTVKTPDTGQSPVVQLIYGSTVFAFEAVMDARYQSSGVTCASWQYRDQETQQEEAAEPDLSQPGNISPSDLSSVFDDSGAAALIHGGAIGNDELKSWADAALIKNRLSKVLGKIVCQGVSDIKPGTLIDLQGMGERFNGNVFVGSVTHVVTLQNWESHVQFGLSPSWFAGRADIADLPASGLVPPVHGLQIGLVTDLEDPDGEFRVKVKMPLISTQEEGIWCRMAQIDAGDNRSLFFRPEVDDEVVLGFLNNDPRHPVILGGLHSSARPSPVEQTSENDEKGIVTRDGLKLLFKDTDKIIHIETPDGKKIILSDHDSALRLEDDHQNVLTLNSSGISIESQGDITITANGDIKLEGTNISCRASATLSADGSTGSELKSGATTKIEGALVQIN